jgi:hypothetical protein
MYSKGDAMSRSALRDSNAVREAVSRMFADKAPVLIEVRFPQMGTSSDWYLCEEENELEAIFERLTPGLELHLQSVWDLPHSNDSLVWKK